MEGAPNIPTPEAADGNEAAGAERELTPEVLTESIEQAIALTESLRALDDTDENGIVIALDKEQWAEAGALSAKLKETLKYIPAKHCLEHGLPYHPTDEKYEYPRPDFPAQPDYPLDYDPQPSQDGARVDQEYPVAA